MKKISPNIWGIYAIEKAAQCKRYPKWQKILPIWSPCPLRPTGKLGRPLFLIKRHNGKKSQQNDSSEIYKVLTPHPLTGTRNHDHLCLGFTS
jgi:hypothetical protein